jgi:hypothetical protein
VIEAMKMNMHPRACRRRCVTAAAAAATLAALVMLVAACGSSSGSGTTTAADPQRAALAYAQCMRDNGVPDFPDPDPNGRFSGLSHEQQGNPRFQAAQQACRDLAPGGEHENLGDPAFVEQARAYAQCIRDNGVPDFPDPDPSGRFRGVGHEQQGNPKFQAASAACQEKLPGGGHQ